MNVEQFKNQLANDNIVLSTTQLEQFEYVLSTVSGMESKNEFDGDHRA